MKRRLGTAIVNLGQFDGHLRYVYRRTPPSSKFRRKSQVSGDTQAWSELHFLHLSRKDLYYTSYLMGNPFKEHIMQTPGTKSRGLSAPDWLVMSTGSEAAGIGGKNISAWDASNEFVYYILKQRPDLPSEVNQRSFEGLLYFGPSVNTEAWFGRWLGKTAILIVTLTPRKPPKCKCLNKKQTDLPRLRTSSKTKRPQIAFSGPDMGFSILGLQHKQSNEIFCENNEHAPGHWSLVFTSPNSEEKIVINNKSAFDGTAEKIQNGIRFIWSNLDLSGEKKVLDIISDIVQNKESNQFEWKLTVINRSKTWGLWTAEYPYLPTILANQDGEMLLQEETGAGRIVKNPTSTFPRDSLHLSPHAIHGVQYQKCRTLLCCPRPRRYSKAPTLETPAGHHNQINPGKRRTARNKPQAGILSYSRPITETGECGEIYRNWCSSRSGPQKTFVNRKIYPKQFIDNGFWLCLSGTPQQIKGIMEETAKI